MSQSVAIIPARGGSKRIPGKNIRSFCGQPIIGYSIQAAQKTGLFSRIIVSTDSSEIADVAKNYNAEVPFMRPDHLADDHAGQGEVLLHVLEELQKEGELPEFFCCLYATAPFVTPEFLKKGLDQLIQHQADGAFSVGVFEAPVFRALQMEGDILAPLWPQYVNSRSNDLPTAYHDAGQFYWYKTLNFLKDKEPWPKKSVPVILPRHLVQDIDTPEDWAFAERLFMLNKRIK